MLAKWHGGGNQAQHCISVDEAEDVGSCGAEGFILDIVPKRPI